MTQSFTPVSSIGEFGLIDRIERLLPDPLQNENIVCGIGDDAAVYRASDGLLQVITTDALIEGVHFDRALTPMSYLGAKAVTVNVSDIVAMNARPKLATISLGVPRNMSVEMVEALYTGISDACSSYDVTLVGGDTTSAQALYLAITMVGEGADDQIVFRRGAREGDVICVSGDLGAAYAGLQVLLDQKRALDEMGEAYEPDLEAQRKVIDRQLAPLARLDFLGVLEEFNIHPTSMIDISDGLASEIHHICRQSQTGATIRIATLPIDPVTRAVADQFMDDVDTYVFYGGEDYELLLTASPEDGARLEKGGHVAIIGEVLDADSGVHAFSPEAGLIPLEGAGYDHFEQPFSGDGI